MGIFWIWATILVEVSKTLLNFYSFPGDCSEYMEQVVSTQDNKSSVYTWSCKVCGKAYVSKSSMQDHIRSAHLGTQSSFPCFYCDRTFQSRNSRSGHCSKHHKLEMGKIWIKCFSNHSNQWQLWALKQDKSVSQLDQRCFVISIFLTNFDRKVQKMVLWNTPIALLLGRQLVCQMSSCLVQYIIRKAG